MNNEEVKPKKTLKTLFKLNKEDSSNKGPGYVEKFKTGSLHTKISYLVMGYGNLARKQFTKGILFLLIELMFLYIMIFSPETNSTPIGGKAIVNFFTLGTQQGDIFTPTDNSMLMLLFGIVTFGIIGLFIGAYLLNIASSYKADKDIEKGLQATTFKDDVKSLLDERFHILMLTPALIGILTFTILPTLFMISIAFTNFDSLHPAGQVLFDWVGFKNFTDIFSGEGEIAVRFLPVLSWTLVWAFFATFTNYIGGILLALLINRKGVAFKKMWRTIFIITVALPQFISLLTMRKLLAESGPINSMLMNLGLIDDPILFLTSAASAWMARATIIVINIWIGIPFTMLMVSGILMNIPKDLYEAAQIDGATKFKAFIHVTVPYIIFITTPYLITAFIGNITNFNVIFLLTNGAPAVPGYVAGETDLLITWLYKLTIDQADYNIGSVVGILTFMITASATLLTYRRSKAFKEEEAFQQ